MEREGIECWVDPTATVDPTTKVWHYAKILAHAKVGYSCSIGAGAEVGRNCRIGDCSRISSGVFLPSYTVIGRDVFVGPGVIMCDDKFPVANNSAYRAEPPLIEDGASIGAGAVILPGVRIGKHAMVAAGAIVTHDVMAGQLVKGLPAREAKRS